MRHLRGVIPGLARRSASETAIAARRMNADHRPLPDFVILGAQKAGTSTLYAQLAAHPQVVPAFRKEVHFFDREKRDPTRYRAHFATARTRARAEHETGAPVLTGEATPFYLVHPLVPARMHELLPEARLIVVLRDPVERAVSGYHHAVRFGHEDRVVDEALDPAAEEPVGSDHDAGWWDSDDNAVRRRGYLARGRYAEQLERWLWVYPREQLLVLEVGELASGAARGRVEAFLGLQPSSAGAVRNRNVRTHPGAGALSATTRQRLGDYFAPHDASLWNLLGARWDWN